MVDRSHVVIVGAGYAGLNAALRLGDRGRMEREGYDLTLVDQHPYHLVKIRLHEAAVHHADVTTPLDDLLEHEGVLIHHGAVTGLDLDRRRVLTTTGEVAYDYLILALGSVTNFFGLPGLAEHSFTLDSLEDAMRLHGHVESQIVIAAAATDAADRERRLRVVIGGAGYTGIELAGELTELLPELCDRVGLDKDAGQILVVDAMPRILPVLDEESAAYAARELERKGVRFRTGVKVASCSDEGVTLDPGGLIPTATMIWAGGIRANPVVASAGAELGKQGRLVVDTALRLPGHPEVYAVGDCALALDPSTNQPVPATAQLALQEGAHAADNILRVLSSQEPTPFNPHSRGEIVSIGHDRAVGWTKALGDKQIKLRGLIGGLAKRAAEAEWELHLWRETVHLDGVFH